MRNGSHVKHGYSNEFLDSDRVANVYFTSDVDAKSRMLLYPLTNEYNTTIIFLLGSLEKYYEKAYDLML